MIRVTINRSSCEGYGNCLRAAPAVFDLDGDGLALVLTQPGDDQLARIRRASYDCPTDSISYTQDSAAQ